MTTDELKTFGNVIPRLGIRKKVNIKHFTVRRTGQVMVYVLTTDRHFIEYRLVLKVYNIVLD